MSAKICVRSFIHYIILLLFSSQTGLAYDLYLRQVVEVLETDPGFREKLEKANVSDIKVMIQ